MKQKNAVVYVITHLELGGAQKVCLRLFNDCASDEIDTFLIAGAHGPLVASVVGNPRVLLLKSLQRALSIRGIINEIKSFFIIYRYLKKVKKEYAHVVVHTHCSKAGLIGRFAAFFARIKMRVHTIHGYAFHDHQPRIIRYAIIFLEWATSLITTHFVCVSSVDQATGIAYFPRFEKKASLIRAAVDEQFYIAARHTPQFPISDEPFIFGSISCFKPQKNLFDLLHAFKLVHEKNRLVRLELIGDGVLRTAIETWITQHHLESAITLHGWQQNVAPIMANWHAYTMSSLWEGLPCAIVEARLFHLPIISYQTGGIGDVIISGKNGFLIPQKKWLDLATAMRQLSNDPALYTTLCAYPDQLQPFYAANMVKGHQDMYKQA